MIPVTVYGMESCSYCTKAVKLLEQHAIPYVYKDILEDEVACNTLKSLGDFRTVPQIFVGDVHIGGYTELEEDLEELL